MLTTFQKSYSGGGNDEGLNAITTADRGSIVCGRTTSGTTGDNDGFLLKLDGQGLVQWSKKYGGSQHDELQFVIATTDGNYVAAGVSQSFGQPAGTLWVIKTDATGNL